MGAGENNNFWLILIMLVVILVVASIISPPRTQFSPEEGPVIVGAEEDSARALDDELVRPGDEDFITADGSDSNGGNPAGPPVDADISGEVTCSWSCPCDVSGFQNHQCDVPGADAGVGAEAPASLGPDGWNCRAQAMSPSEDHPVITLSVKGMDCTDESKKLKMCNTATDDCKALKDEVNAALDQCAEDHQEVCDDNFGFWDPVAWEDKETGEIYVAEEYPRFVQTNPSVGSA